MSPFAILAFKIREIMVYLSNDRLRKFETTLLMRTSIKTVLENYQTRKTRLQKEEFIQWLNPHLNEQGYQIKTQKFKKGRGKNLIIGNPETAEIILTAHYDTPPNAIIPIATIVGSIPMYIMSQILIFLPIVGLLWLAYRGISSILGNLGILSNLAPFLWFEIPLLVLLALILWSLQMMMGLANKNNANDNTSGVSVMLALLEDLPQQLREKVCFVFFDEEEKGLEGAKVFKQRYRESIKNKPLINFDCVAHGQQLLFISKKSFCESDFYHKLELAVGDKGLMKNAIHYAYASDQLIFKLGVGVVAVHKLPLVGYYLSRLHSRWDKSFDENNIEKIAQIMLKFISSI